MTEVAERNLMNEWANKEIKKALYRLPRKQRDIIKLRFGLEKCSNPKTLEDIGFIYGVSRERIRQIQNVALGKLNQYLTKRLKGEIGNFKEAINDR